MDSLLGIVGGVREEFGKKSPLDIVRTLVDHGLVVGVHELFVHDQIPNSLHDFPFEVFDNII